MIRLNREQLGKIIEIVQENTDVRECDCCGQSLETDKEVYQELAEYLSKIEEI